MSTAKKPTVIGNAGSEGAPIGGALVPKLPLLATLSVITGGTALPGERPLFSMTAGQDRRARVQSIHDRTGWVFARCREMVDTMTDAQIEAAVRQHEETQRAEIVETHAVLAGAYKGKRLSLRETLTHSVALKNGRFTRVLCGSVDLDSMADCEADDIDAPPTCARCLTKDPRFKAQRAGSERR